MKKKPVLAFVSYDSEQGREKYALAQVALRESSSSAFVSTSATHASPNSFIFALAQQFRMLAALKAKPGTSLPPLEVPRKRGAMGRWKLHAGGMNPLEPESCIID